MTIAFISDLHLTPTRAETTQWFEQFMLQAKKKLKTVYILGDLFEYWVGDDGSITLGHQQVENIIRHGVDNGLQVYFMHGNRDFLVGETFSQKTGCKLLPDPFVLELDGRKILLSHGDALCTDDKEHQASREVMLSESWKSGFLKKPLSERITIAQHLRNSSKQHKKQKTMKMMDVNPKAVESLMLQYGVLHMIHGHTHKPGVHDFSLLGQKAIRYVLGDWYTQKSILLYQKGNLSLSR